MQYVNCQVFLSGDRNHSVSLDDISVAEVVVLRNLHGGDAVHNVEPTKNRKIEHRKVLDQLLSKYSTRARDIRESIFPGAAPQLPTTLKDIGIDRKDVRNTRNSKKTESAESAESDETDETESDETSDLAG